MLLVNLPIVWDWIACKLLTSFVIFFHVIISHDYRFFFEVPRFEELQDSKIVARVGGKSAVALSGIMEASYSRFFIGRGFDR